MKDAQYRKGLSIAFFNANNVAVQMVEMEAKIKPPLMKVTAGKVKKGKKVKKIKTTVKPASLTDRIVFYRDWLIKEHADYYARVIAPVGVNFKPEDSIAKLMAAKTLPDLQTAWKLLSEDERHDPSVLKVAKELRKKYND